MYSRYKVAFRPWRLKREKHQQLLLHNLTALLISTSEAEEEAGIRVYSLVKEQKEEEEEALRREGGKEEICDPADFFVEGELFLFGSPQTERERERERTIFGGRPAGRLG